MVFAQIPDGRSSTWCGMGPDMVVGNREAPGIPPVLVKDGCDGGGFIELLAPKCAGTARRNHSVWDCVAG